MQLKKGGKIIKEDLDFLLGKILLLVIEQESNKVIMVLDKWIENYPSISAPYFWKGIYFQYWENNLEEALLWYEKSVDLLDINKGVNLLNIKRNKYPFFHAYSCFANPEVVIQQYINASAIANRLNDAEKTIKKANLLLVDDFDLVYFDMYLAMMRGEYEIVEKECRNQIARKNYKGMSFEYWLLLAQCYLNQNRISEGFESIENALRWDPTYYESLGVLGSLHIKMKIGRQLKKFILNALSFYLWILEIGIYYRFVIKILAKLSWRNKPKQKPCKLIHLQRVRLIKFLKHRV